MPDSFSLVVLPDTQFYSQSYPAIFTTQTQWIKDNKDLLNIVFVLHEGDIVNGNRDYEWDNADTSMSILDTFVPYIMTVGGHDAATIEDPPGDPWDTTKFKAHFPVSRYSGESWWGGANPADTDSRYVFFSIYDLDFMIITMNNASGIAPTDETIAWASGIVAANPDKRVIVLTHSYINYLGEISTGSGNIWTNLVKLHSNIFLTLNGHEWVYPSSVAKRTSKGDYGNVIYQLLANYQLELNEGEGNCGDGWLRILTFIPRDNKIEVRTYSPHLDKYKTDDANSFDLPYRMTANIPTNVILQKNKVSTASAWLVLLEITLTDSTVYRLVQNNEDIVFCGQTYTAFNFQLDPSTQSNSGEIPTITLSVSNITRLIEAKLQELDGGIGSTVKIIVVNSELLSEDFSELEMTYDVLTCHATAKEVVFILGAPSPLRQRFPVDKYLALHCAWAFRSVECGYDGSSGVTCDRTLAACRDYGNSERFGGFPSMRSGSVQVVR